MAQAKKHIEKRAGSRSFSFLQPKQVACSFFAFILAFSLFPTQALAADTSSASSPQVLTTDSSKTNEAASSTDTSTSTSTGTQATNEANTQVANPSVAAGNTVVEKIEIGTEPLNLIQNGNYDAEEAAANSAKWATSTGATAPTTDQRNQIKARLNTALMNVSYTTYNSQANWCKIDISDLKAPLASNATSYAKTLVEEVINENPDLFYAGASYGAGTKTTTTSSGSTIIISTILVQYYYTPSSIAGMKTKYETAMETMLSWVSATKSYKNSTDAEKAKAVHDWLVRNCKYNYNAYLKGSPKNLGSWDPWSAYGAVVNKAPVCEGYSLAFMAAMQRLGIQATFVTNANHGWNRVRLKVGSTYYWYNLDITYDDPLKAGNNYADGGYNTTPSTKYFLKSDSYFKTKLGENSSSGTHVKWTPTGTAGTNTTFDATWAGGVYPLASNTHTVTTISLSPTTLTMGTDASATLTLKATGNNVVTGLAKWTSSSPSVASVSSNAVVTTGSKTGTATITVSLGGKTATCTITVKKGISMSSAAVSLATSGTITYKSGTAQKPKLKVVLGGVTLTEGTDYSASYPSDTINPGTKTVTITGKNAYTGTKTFTYTITCPLSSVAKTGAKNFTYNGSVQKNTLTLTFKGSNNYSYTLKEGTDYTVTWPSDVTNAGTKTVTITGRGAYTGTYKYTYKINPIALGSATVTYDATKRYTGKAITQSPTVKVGSTTIPASSYTISYKNNTKVGTATMTITGKGNATGTKTVTFKIVNAATWTRLSGYYALDTMAAISKKFGTATTAIVASNADFKDSLAAIGLAGSLSAPVLTTEKASLSSQTKSELNRLGVTTVYIVGSTSDVSSNVESQIKKLSKVTTVTRISGSGASAKAIACAKKQGSNRSGTVIIATQKSFKDALSISSYAYATKSPIIYVETNLQLSTASVNYIKSAGFSNAIIVGGGGAIPTSVETQLANAGIAKSKQTRLAGYNCYNTSRVIAEWAMGKLKNGTGPSTGTFYKYASVKFQPSIIMGINYMGVSRGDNWKDALAGSALCGKNSSIILLIDGSNTSNTSIISKYKTSISQGYIFGGTGAVSTSAETAIKNASK